MHDAAPTHNESKSNTRNGKCFPHSGVAAEVADLGGGAGGRGAGEGVKRLSGGRDI